MFLFFFLAQRIVIYYAVHSRAILKIVKSMCNGIKKNQMHAQEMSYKCRLYPTLHSCHINFRSMADNKFRPACHCLDIKM
jgi:hypothetical protein